MSQQKLESPVLSLPIRRESGIEGVRHRIQERNTGWGRRSRTDKTRWTKRQNEQKMDVTREIGSNREEQGWARWTGQVTKYFRIFHLLPAERRNTNFGRNRLFHIDVPGIVISMSHCRLNSGRHDRQTATLGSTLKMSDFTTSQWYDAHSDHIPHEIRKRFPQPMIRGLDGRPVAARLIVSPQPRAVSGGLIEYAAVIAVNPRPDPAL
ncbi:hypothetical protein NCU03540 [Neurospora crassa OR74A]|uniref:Uncharacterized protein n=2 Tax=Neurospora crassa TaxID=5141 RepID=Q1K5D4_NEUCR|nr:hypothetical protein NCU03540 [Neurospora crassa OR74A]EAA27583.1 hypothetical protein NCU03540 [Neurospora crassa OR74A]CAD11330.1 hypothetical protein [Neurospora crassa]|eukprot:XP_956819.1 hypothetical protein NCU03540 [Neurospora crassa OR74A]